MHFSKLVFLPEFSFQALVSPSLGIAADAPGPRLARDDHHLAIFDIQIQILPGQLNVSSSRVVKALGSYADNG